ncbi:MAM and LDL-receptor class A domain-containing protein 1-like [Mytilus edulis]|uniref:MAM and LDL-receptor class A domain-containing protein 1-like n=1 Tax=Mytilus edulis TaxID=6550 RepID=UPI0039EE07AF
MMKFGCLIVIIICIIRFSYGGRLTGNCLAKNGTCGKKGVSCDNAFGEGWIDIGNCCYGKPCCKKVIKDLCRSTSYSCGFEQISELCVFKQSANDQFDWSRNSGSTSTPDTGPSAAAEGTYYIYTDVSSELIDNKAKCILTTEATNLQACPYCLSFKYHMKGTDITSLLVFAGDKASLAPLTSIIWEKTGSQTTDPAKWDTGTIDIPQYSNLVVRIRSAQGKPPTFDRKTDNPSQLRLESSASAGAGFKLTTPVLTVLGL